MGKCLAVKASPQQRIIPRRRDHPIYRYKSLPTPRGGTTDPCDMPDTPDDV